MLVFSLFCLLILTYPLCSSSVYSPPIPSPPLPFPLLISLPTLRRCSPLQLEQALASIYKEAGVEWASWRDFKRDNGSSQGKEEEEEEEEEAEEEGGDGKDDGASHRDPLEITRVGQSPKWLRPGGGFWSNTILDEAEAAGYSTVLGNVFSWDVFAPAAHNVWFTRERARPGCIVILHDRPKLLETLGSLLPSLSAQYKIVTLTELFKRVAEAERDL